MKKLLAGFCCILFLHSFSRTSSEQILNSQKVAGEKMLIKALAVIANTEGNKKAPAKTVHVFSNQCPW
jgi:hypothetical protein